MSLRLKFLVSLLALLALMTVPALHGVTRITALRDIVMDMGGQAAQSGLAAGRLQALLGQVDRYQRLYVATADAEHAVEMREALDEAATEVAILRAAGYGDAVNDAGVRLDPMEQATDHTVSLVEQGMLDSATTFLITTATPLIERGRTGVPAIAGAIDARATGQVASAQRTAVTAGTATTLAFAVALALAFALAFGASSVLTRPIDRLRRAMARVAEGTFEAPPGLPYDRHDELGELFRSFRAMTLRLSELDCMKAEFIATASHDLKTPISIIGGYAEMMQDELDSALGPRHRELLASLTDQTRALQHRIDQLLDISRMEAGRLRLGIELIDLRHFADGIRQEFEPAARSSGLRFELSLDENTPPLVMGDPDILRHDVLGNLIGNALKFTPAGGLIRMSVRPDGDSVHVEVADTGPGIPTDQIGRIFEKYYQGRGSMGGAGLGLAIARAAVEAHGGRIEVQSSVGRGTRFRVILPIGTAALTDAAQEPVHA
ncbi:MAG: HAMP domain-containing sensor histidine kinase [Gemmatimonadota bacterium]